MEFDSISMHNFINYTDKRGLTYRTETVINICVETDILRMELMISTTITKKVIQAKVVQCFIGNKIFTNSHLCKFNFARVYLLIIKLHETITQNLYNLKVNNFCRYFALCIINILINKLQQLVFL